MHPQTSWAVEARGLTKSFGAERAVDGVDLRVAPGTVHAILGPNGAGKTTVVRLLTTLLRPDEGTIAVHGRDVVRQAHAVRHLISVTGQYASIDETLSAVENLVLIGRLQGLTRRAARRRADRLLEEFTLVDAADKPLAAFSGGMRRRLDLAASLLVRRPVLFLDEPTTGLDPRTREGMWRLVRRLVGEGTTVVLTTQYLEEADRLADRICVIDTGRVVAEGTTDSLKESVGVSTLSLRLADDADPVASREIVASVLGTRPTMETDHRLTASMADPRAVTDLLIALRRADLEPREVSVAKPSLDEVFLALTGHGPRSGEDPGREGDPVSTDTAYEDAIR